MSKSLFSDFNIAPAVSEDGWYTATIKRIVPKKEAWFVTIKPFKMNGDKVHNYASVLTKLEFDADENSVADSFSKIFAKAKKIEDIEGSTVRIYIRITEGKSKTYYNVDDIEAIDVEEDEDEETYEDEDGFVDDSEDIEEEED